MKVFILTTEYPPFYGGGISTYCLHTVSMLAEKNHQVTVIVPDSNLETEEYIDHQGNVQIVRFKPAMKEIYKYLGYAAALSYDFADRVVDLIKREGAPDIIECQEYHGIGYFLIHRKKQLDPYLKDIPISINLHSPKFLCDEIGQAPLYKLPDYWIGEMERFCIKAADLIVSPSRFLIEKVKENLDFDEQKVVVIPNPYKVPNSNEDITFIPNEMIFLGRVQYLKGLDQLISHLSLLWEENVKIPLKVIGADTIFPPKNTTFMEYLKKKYKKYINENLILFEGLLPSAEVQRRLEESHVVFVPSLFESFSYAVVEAMAKGKVVFASDNGGQREIIISGENGFIFSHNNPENFITELKKFLQFSNQEVISIGKKARNRIETLCSYDNVYSLKITAWKNCIENHKHSEVYPFIRNIPHKQSREINQNITSEKDLLSIVIPYYNMGKWIQDTLESLRHIKYIDHEIILVNDGSTDEYSLQLLEELKNKYPIRIIHKKNGGLASARNEGATHARGEFLAFLDADDMVTPEYYNKAIEILKTYNNVSFVGSWLRYFEGASGIWPTWNPEPPFFLVHNTVNSSSLVYKKKDFLMYGLNDSDMVYGMEDYESVIRMVESGCRGVVITEPHFIYRVRSDSMSRQFNYDNQSYLYRLITNKHLEFYREYAADIFNIINQNGPAYLYDNPTWPLPPCGFVTNSVDLSNVNMESSELPVELKQRLVQLWSNNKFKKLVKIVFKLKLDRLFK